MEYNFNSLINASIIAEIEKENPITAKLFKVFAKRGIPVAEAMAMTLELIAIIEEMKKSEEQTNDEI